MKIKTIAEAKGEDYDGLDLEAFEAQAEAAEVAGFDVVPGGPWVLLVDIDGPEALATFRKNRKMCEELFGVQLCDSWASKSGEPDHLHIRLIVAKDRTLTVPERLVIQAALGADLVATALQLARYHRGVKEPIRAFRPEGAEVRGEL